MYTYINRTEKIKCYMECKLHSNLMHDCEGMGFFFFENKEKMKKTLAAKNKIVYKMLLPFFIVSVAD